MSWQAVARDQAGFIARSQLRAAGVPARTVDHWRGGRRLDATRSDGVYRVAGSPHSRDGAAWFAALATRSPVSFLTAGQWWEMLDDSDDLVHVTRFDRRRLDWPPGVRVHRVRLSRGDVSRHRGLWVTTRQVTALDCIGWLRDGRALTFADRALARGWVTQRDIARRLEDEPGRWGNRRLRRVAAHLERGAEAESERRLHRVLRSAGITGWTPQLVVPTPTGTFRVDVAFPSLRLAIEVDGYAYHSGDDRFQRDRTKQNGLLAAGWRVLRFTWADIVDRPEYVVAEITALLAA